MAFITTSILFKYALSFELLHTSLYIKYGSLGKDLEFSFLWLAFP